VHFGAYKGKSHCCAWTIEQHLMLLYIAAASDGSHRRRCSGLHRERGSLQHRPHATCAIVQVVGHLLSDCLCMCLIASILF